MIANGGKNIDVSIVKSVIKPDGTEVSKGEIKKYANEKTGTEKRLNNT